MNQEAAALYDIEMLYDLNMDLKEKKKTYSYSKSKSVTEDLVCIRKIIDRERIQKSIFSNNSVKFVAESLVKRSKMRAGVLAAPSSLPVGLLRNTD